MQCGHSGPRVMVRSLSSCPRWKSPPGGIGLRQRQQLTTPSATMRTHTRRSDWNSLPYPRCALVPLARSASALCVLHLRWSVMAGHPGLAQIRLAAAIVAVLYEEVVAEVQCVSAVLARVEYAATWERDLGVSSCG